MNYVDGYVLPIQKSKLKAYAKLAKLAGKIWLEHGALDYKECVGDDLAAKGLVPFTKLAKVKPGETVIFAWIVFKSKSHRDKVNAKVMEDPRLQCMDKDSVPFDCKRMAYGGFTELVGF